MYLIHLFILVLLNSNADVLISQNIDIIIEYTNQEKFSE